MNRPLFKRIRSHALAWAAVFALGGALALALAQDASPTAGPRSDGQIEMDVVHALDGSQALKNDLITAATIQGEVTLSGTVSSDASRQLAESLVKGVPGVTNVKNNLKVGDPANDPNAGGAPASDQGDMADNSQAPPPPDAGPGPDYSQNAPPPNGQDSPNLNQAPPPSWGQNAPRPAYGQNAPPPPGYGQDGQNGPPPGYGQNAPPPPGYGQNAPPPPGYGQNAPPPGYGQNYPPQQQGYGRPQYAPPPPRYEMPRGPVTLGPGAVLQVRTVGPVDSKRAKPGEPLDFTVIQDVTVNGVLAIPRGATVHGVIADVKQSGALAGSAGLALQLTSLDLMGQNYPIQSDLFKVKGPSKGEHTAGNVIGGALLGAIIGGAIGRGEGAAIGAAAGGGAGVAASAASNPGVWIPAEALVTFRLTDPVTVQPVSQQEAMRLAQGLYPGGPTLYRRPGYRPYPYYAPVYYRPYVFTGGYYYWR